MSRTENAAPAACAATPAAAPAATAPSQAPADTARRSTSGGRRTVLRRGAAVVLAAGAMIAPTMVSSPAHAMNSPQTTTSGVVNLLGGTSTGSVYTFWSTTMRAWGYTYTSPKLYYYNYTTLGSVNTSCGVLGVNNSFYCSSANGIYLDYRWNQTLINSYGDFGAGGVLAHEWGHAIDAWLGYNTKSTAYTAGGYRNEYHADCLAGMYVRNGYATGRLNGSDYGEFYNWLATRAFSTTHGSGANRAAWYQYGYTQYSLAACNQVYALPSTPSAARTAVTSESAMKKTSTQVRPGLLGKAERPTGIASGTAGKAGRIPSPPVVGTTAATPSKSALGKATPPPADLGAPADVTTTVDTRGSATTLGFRGP